MCIDSSDHFNKLVKEWRQTDNSQKWGSGQVNGFTEREQPLTNICLYIDDFEEEKTQVMHDKDTKQNKLKQYGELVRDAAMKDLTPQKRSKTAGHVFVL